MTTAPKKNLMDRLDTLEAQTNKVSALENLSVSLRQTLTSVIETMNAIVEELSSTLGSELGPKIVQRLEDKQLANRREQANRSAAVLKQLIDGGRILGRLSGRIGWLRNTFWRRGSRLGGNTEGRRRVNGRRQLADGCRRLHLVDGLQDKHRLAFAPGHNQPVQPQPGELL